MKIKIATSAKDLMNAFLIRREVFIKEQNVSFAEEFDLDELSQTVFIAYDEKKAVGTARIKIIDNYAKVGRFCVLKEYRRKNVGKGIMTEMIKFAKKKKCASMKLGAQIDAVAFYETLGFITVGEEYIEANIKHKDMIKTL